MTVLLTRTKRFDGQKYWLTTNAIKSDYDGKWSNCLYLHFTKDDFLQIKSPPLIDCDWYAKNGKRFNYSESVLTDLPFHGGITFYEETIRVESGNTYVKVGCDYRHFMDDEFEMSDHGGELLETDGQEIIDAFLKLLETV